MRVSQNLNTSSSSATFLLFHLIVQLLYLFQGEWRRQQKETVSLGTLISGGSKGDAMDAPSLRIQILSISCSFWEKLAKSYVGAPSSGKSWIRHCSLLIIIGYIYHCFRWLYIHTNLFLKKNAIYLFVGEPKEVWLGMPSQHMCSKYHADCDCPLILIMLI